MTDDLCFATGAGTACLSFDSETLTLKVNDVTRQTWTTAIVADKVLMETGDFVLLETDDKVLLE